MTVQRLFIYLKKFSKNAGRVHLITFQIQIGFKLHLSLSQHLNLTKNPQKRDIIWRKAFFWRPIQSNCSPFRLYSAWNLNSYRLQFFFTNLKFVEPNTLNKKSISLIKKPFWDCLSFKHCIECALHTIFRKMVIFCFCCLLLLLCKNVKNPILTQFVKMQNQYSFQTTFPFSAYIFHGLGMN